MCLKDMRTCDDKSCPNWNASLECCGMMAKQKAEAVTCGEFPKTREVKEGTYIEGLGISSYYPLHAPCDICPDSKNGKCEAKIWCSKYGRPLL